MRPRCKKAICWFIAGCLMSTGMIVNAYAHIKNEATQFPDIEFSDARFDIVVLVGAGIIPETPVFEPDKPLSLRELASWAALAEGLLRGGETPDVTALATAALDKGLVGSLDGDATIADLNHVFFADSLAVDDINRTPTKAEAAMIIATALGGDAGLALLKKRRLVAGATGDVEAVTITEGHHGNAYVITIDGNALQMDEHGRVANGPTDLLQWEGRRVARSFVRTTGKTSKWVYLEALPRTVATISAPAAVGGVGAEIAPAEDTVAKPEPDRRLLYGLIVAAAVFALLLFFRRRQTN